MSQATRQAKSRQAPHAMTTIASPVTGRIHRLWDELALMPASKPERALHFLFEGIGGQVDCDHGFWLSAVRMHDAAPRDPLNGWRSRAIYFYGQMSSDQASHAAILARFNRGQPDESTYRHVRRAGAFRATLLSDHVSSAFFDSDFYYEHYLGRGIIDRLFVVMPLNNDVESYFIFDRLRGQEPFAYRDLEIARYALRSLGWFNRQVHLSYGEIVAESPLTPTERAVLKSALAGKAEKDIAKQLGHSHHTTHRYVTGLFRKFNVASRTELMALWLGH